MGTGSAVIVLNLCQRVGTILVRADRAAAEAKLDEQGDSKNGERYCDGERNHVEFVSRAGPAQHIEQIEHGVGGEEGNQNPDRQVTVVGAFYCDGELGIGEGEVDYGAQSIAADVIGDQAREEVGDINPPIAIQNVWRPIRP